MSVKKVKRDEKVAVRLNSVELNKLTQFALENGISVSEALRLLVQKLS
jgi:hypothetical protein